MNETRRTPYDVAKTLSNLVDTTVGYLLGEAKEVNVIKDLATVKRLMKSNAFSKKER